MKIQEIRPLAISLNFKQQAQVKGGSSDNNNTSFIIGVDVDTV